MWSYFVILLFVLVLSVEYDILDRTRHKILFYRIILIISILLSGFRFRVGLDTVQYLELFYSSTPKIEELSYDNLFSSYMEPLFLMMMSIVKSLFGRFYFVQLLQAIIVNALIFKYIRKHSSYIFFCVFLYFVWKYFTYNMEEMRASIALVICLYANDYIIEKKVIKGMLLFLISLLFHYSAALLLLTPIILIINKRLDFRGWLIIMVAMIICIGYRSILGELMVLLSFNEVLLMKLSYYSTESGLMEQKLNFNGILFVFFQYILIILVSTRTIVENNRKFINLEPFLFIGVLFVVISIPISLFYRYVNFYIIYFVLFYSEFFIENIKKYKKTHVIRYVSKSLFLFFPYFLTIFLTYSAKVDKTQYSTIDRYIPYTSVFNRTFELNRERLLNYYMNTSYKENEY